MGGITLGFDNILPILNTVGFFAQNISETLDGISNFSLDPLDPEEERRKQLRAEQDLALQQLQAKQSLQEQQLQQSSELERERIAKAAEIDEKNRRQALKRAVARQRAQFGASGIGGGGGSSEAVLLGMFEETDEERARRESLDNLRTRAIELDTSQTRSLNLLQATQLSQRQNLQRQFF